ncbi:hypothetical protein FA10DRAFT_260094 [Acaromyces ingoldii]|uniref:Uncharacterized protein n=1 Tax=Acaromyces ingoldii TaxID=215250 RepID=A0A316YR36_9BASI|nr:hypothetical protein FA10DRAFT_260094 [Acaromyces ingoldii]PWN90225.1 hypothetical protein FA10DRAFT_260094 [Acaromyces ingoldii]
MSSLSLADPSSPMPSSSSLIVDNEGQAHDPGYVGALRLIHAQIGARAEGGTSSAPPSVSSFSSPRRPSSGGGGGSHAPIRPSNLGLSSHGHGPRRSRSTLTTSTFSYSSSSDLDDDDDDDDIAGNGRNSDEDADFSFSRDSDLRRAASLARASMAGAGPSSRHSSFSNSALRSAERTPPNAPRSDLSGLGLSGPSPPPSSSSSPPPQLNVQQEGNESRRMSWTSRSGSHSKTNRSPARNSTSHDDGGMASGNWGFTGIVDVERERERHRANNSPDLGLDDLDGGSYSFHSPSHTELVAAASLSKSRNSGAPATASRMGTRTPPQTLHGSIKRPSSSTLASNGDASLAKGLHSSPSAASKKPLGWSNGPSSEAGSSTTGHAKPSSLRERVRSRTTSGEQPQYLEAIESGSASIAPPKQRKGLSTILSGRPFSSDDANSFDSFGRAPRGSVEGASVLPDLHHPRVSHEVDPDLADADFSVGPSRMKQAKEFLSKKSHNLGEEAHDSPNHLRRKMQSIALGVRFKTFKVRKSIERRF